MGQKVDTPMHDYVVSGVDHGSKCLKRTASSRSFDPPMRWKDKLRLTLIFLRPKVPATAGAERNKRKNNIITKSHLEISVAFCYCSDYQSMRA